MIGVLTSSEKATRRDSGKLFCARNAGFPAGFVAHPGRRSGTRALALERSRRTDARVRRARFISSCLILAARRAGVHRGGRRGRRMTAAAASGFLGRESCRRLSTPASGTAGAKRRRSRSVRFEDALGWRAAQPNFACTRLADAKVPSLRCHCPSHAEARLTRCACRSAPVLEAGDAGPPPFVRTAPWQEKPALHEDPFALPEHLFGEIMSGRLLSPARPAPRPARALSSLGSARARRWAD